MTRNEMENWLLTHGFHQITPDILVASYAKSAVKIEFLKRYLRVSFVQGKIEHRRLSVPISAPHIQIDKAGFLSGIGIGASMMNGLITGGPVPVWLQDVAYLKNRYRENNSNSDRPA